MRSGGKSMRKTIVFKILLLFTFFHFAFADCKKLTEKQLSELWMANSFTIQPGETIELKPFTRECCVFDTPVENACILWSMKEKVPGVHLDPDGKVTVDSTAGSGTYEVTGDLEEGKKTLNTKIAIYSPSQNPLVGMWKEYSEFDCTTKKEFEPELKILEAEFKADGTFSITWTPFEVYKDYWGTYTFDLKTGNITLSNISGNYVPKDFDGEGTFSIQQGALVFDNVWLGTHNHETKQPVQKGCGHRLTP
jgi:hypothetical protein